jgi:hypothetical protein
MIDSTERGISEVMGTVLIFGFVVILFSIYQGVVVPQQNQAIEFEHNVDAQGSVQDLRNAIRRTASVGADESVSLKLSASYPPRFIAINPGGSAGSVRTESLGSITLRNISADDAGVAKYFGSNTTTLGPFESKRIVFRPVYFQYRQAPATSYENTLVFNQFPGGQNLSITNQAMIDDRDITLVVLAGNLSGSGTDTRTVDTKAISTASSAVAVTNQSGTLNLTITTRLSATEWTDLLENELTSAGGHVEDVRQTGPNQVSILLEGDVTYELKIAKVGVGADTPSAGPKYIVDEEGDGTNVPENATQKLVVEVRDRFNNPVSNVVVNATITRAANPGDSTEDISPANATTGATGRATFIYSAPKSVSEDEGAKIEVEFDGDGTVNETVTFEVKVLNTQTDVLGGSSDPASQAGDASGLIRLEDTFPVSGTEPYDHVVFQVNNTANESVNVTGFSLSYATQSDQSGTVEDGPDAALSLTVGGQSRSFTAVEGQSPVFFENDPVTLAGNKTLSDIEIRLDDTYVLAKNKEALIIEITIYFQGGFSARYSVFMFDA